MMQPEHDRPGPVQRDAVASRNQYARTIYLYTCAPAGHERPIPDVGSPMNAQAFFTRIYVAAKGNENSMLFESKFCSYIQLQFLHVYKFL